METSTKSGLHPMLWVATIAVTLFSLVGIGALTGMFGNSAPESEALVTPVPPQEALQVPEAATPPGDVVTKEVVPAPAPAPAPAKQAATPAKPTPTKPKVASKPAPAPSASAVEADPLPAPIALCGSCGVVESVRAVEVKGEGSGLGAIAGGVVGGALGNQVGKGSGNTLATIAGAVAGGYAGHQVERNVRKATRYEITVRMDDGARRVLTRTEQPVWREGDRVEVGSGGELSAGR